MIWSDSGYLLSKNKFGENSIIAEFYTEFNGKISGIIFGATSKKIKNFLLIGNHFDVQFNSKNQSKRKTTIKDDQDVKSNKETSKKCISSGANILVSGSYIFKEHESNYKKKID